MSTAPRPADGVARSRPKYTGLLSAGRLVSVALVLVLLGASANAAADPTAADRATARGLMSEGRSARAKGDLQAALKAFSSADSIMHVPTTGLEVAKTQAALGLLLEARDTALRVSRLQERSGEPLPFKAARDAAGTLSDDLEARVPSLTVTVKNVPDGMKADVTLDDVALPPETLGQAKKLDPGHHVVVAKAGTVDAKQEVDLSEKEQKQVEIQLPFPPAPEAAETTLPDEPTPPPEPSPKSDLSKALLFGGFGVGGAGLVVGAITGVLTLTKTSSIKSSCPGNACGPAEFGDISSARSTATVSTVSFIVAGVGAGVGVFGLLTGNKSEASPTDTPAEKPADEESRPTRRLVPRIEPWIGLGAAGLRGTL